MKNEPKIIKLYINQFENASCGCHHQKGCHALHFERNKIEKIAKKSKNSTKSPIISSYIYQANFDLTRVNPVARPFFSAPPQNHPATFTLHQPHCLWQHHRARVSSLRDSNKRCTVAGTKRKMDDYGSETDSDYTSYWRDWVRWARVAGHGGTNLLTLCTVHLVPRQ